MESKFIVFFRHKLVRKAIEEKLVTMKVKYICIAGDVASGIRGVCLSLMYSTVLQLHCFALLIAFCKIIEEMWNPDVSNHLQHGNWVKQ